MKSMPSRTDRGRFARAQPAASPDKIRPASSCVSIGRRARCSASGNWQTLAKGSSAAAAEGVAHAITECMLTHLADGAEAIRIADIPDVLELLLRQVALLEEASCDCAGDARVPLRKLPEPCCEHRFFLRLQAQLLHHFGTRLQAAFPGTCRSPLRRHLTRVPRQESRYTMLQ